MNTHDLVKEPQDSNSLFIALKEKEEEIQFLKGIIGISETVKNVKTYTDIVLLRKDIERIEAIILELRKEYRALDKSRIENIQALEKAINSFGLINKIKHLVKPRIGTLYQHGPKPVSLPNHYKINTPLTNTPTISIVTPSFNQGRYIERTILSIINQHYPSLEYIIQDNESQDNTIDVIKNYHSHLKQWESTKDNGQSSALNKGFSHSTGEIMAYLNSDDMLLPGSLAYVAQYFNEHPKVDVVYGHRIQIDENDQEVGRWILPPHDPKVLTWADYIPQETLFWRRSIWDKVGGKIDESFQFAMDWDLLLRFQEAGAHFMRLPRYLGAFRVHDHQKTATAIAHTGQKEMERLRMRCHGLMVTPKQISKNLRFYLIKHVIYHKLHRSGLIRY